MKYEVSVWAIEAHIQDQLTFKRNVIIKAFRRYFNSDDSLIPEVDATHASPLVYGYRTKITPHFDIPRSRKASQAQSPDEIGFVEKGRRRILDIEGVLSVSSNSNI
jgi:tRNA (uracil-5-)-methyltransferase